jgi:diketogulonate reductase-like aldo/keto reductase
MPASSYDQVRTRLVEHMKLLQVDYIDQLLIHWPGPENVDMSNPDSVASLSTWEHYEQHIATSWANMNRLLEEKLVRSIGVSNFYRKHIEHLLSLCKSQALHPPATLQLYVDATHPEFELVDFAHAHGIAVMAYRSLMFLPALAMAAEMGDATNDALQQYAKQVSAAAKLPDELSVAECVLAWLASRRVCPVVQASQSHLAANLRAVQLGASNAAAFSIDALPFAPSETADMCGAQDEYAAVFRSM